MIFNDVNLDKNEEYIYEEMYRNIALALKSKIKEKYKVDTGANIQFMAKYNALIADLKKQEGSKFVRNLLKVLGVGMLGVSILKGADMSASDLSVGVIGGLGIIGSSVTSDIISHLKYKQYLDEVVELLLNEIKRGEVYELGDNGNIIKSYLIKDQVVESSMAKSCVEMYCEDKLI